MAAGVVAQTELARQAARSHDQAAALDHVRQAESLAAEIQKQTADRPQPVLIPVAQEKETTTTYTDVKRRKSGEMDPTRLKKHTHIGDVEQQTTAEELNVNNAVQHLRAARADLEGMDWMTAETNLSGAVRLVHTESADREMPLLRVERNLTLARTRLLDKKYSAAVAPLREAEQALSDYERQGSGPATQAAEMRQSIEAMAGHIRQNASVEKIDAWLHTLEQWQKQ
jgi:hypothetical protein